MRDFHIDAGIADHPDLIAGGNAAASQRQIDRIGRWFVARRIAGSDYLAEISVPTQMQRLGAQDAAFFVADDGEIKPGPEAKVRLPHGN